MRALTHLVPFALLLGAAGCAETDPYLRPGQWQPTGANSVNLAAMVERPSDLVRGRGTRGTPGIEAAPAVTRYWTGKALGLPNATSQSAVAINVVRNETVNPASEK